MHTGLAKGHASAIFPRHRRSDVNPRDWNVEEEHEEASPLIRGMAEYFKPPRIPAAALF